MNYSVFRFTLNMHNHRSQASVAAFRGDTAIRLLITLTDGGNPYFIEDGCFAVINGTKADETIFRNYCTILNNTVIQYDFTEQTSSCEGVVNCDISLFGADGKLLTAPKFTLVVDEREANNDGLIESVTESSALDEVFKFKASHNTNLTAHQALFQEQQSRLEAHNNATGVHYNAFREHNADKNAHSALFEKMHVDISNNFEDITYLLDVVEDLERTSITDIKVSFSNETKDLTFNILRDGYGGADKDISVNLPLSALKIASVEDYVENGEHYLKIKFEDGTEITEKLDVIFAGIEELLKDKVNTSDLKASLSAVNDAIAKKADKITDSKQIYATDAEGHPTGIEYSEESKGNTIPIRNKYGDIILNTTASPQSGVRAAVSVQQMKTYVNGTAATKETETELAEIQTKVNKIEGMLINCTVDSTEAYAKRVPTKSVPKAMLNSVGGKTIKKGSRNICTDAVEGGKSVTISASNGAATLLSYSLPSGTYYIDIDVEIISGSMSNLTTKYSGAYGEEWFINNGVNTFTEDVTLYVEGENQESEEDCVCKVFPTIVQGTEAPEGYEPYEAPSLEATKVTEIVSRGRNLVKNTRWYGGENYGTVISTTEPTNVLEVTQTKYIPREEESYSGDFRNGYVYYYFEETPLTPNKRYKISFDIDIKTNPLNYDKMFIRLGGGSGSAYLPATEKGKIVIILTPTETTSMLELRNMGMSYTISNVMITNENADISTYSPYIAETYALPKAVVDDEDWGASVSGKVNTYDFDNKAYSKYAKIKVFDGTEEWIWQTVLSGTNVYYDTPIASMESAFMCNRFTADSKSSSTIRNNAYITRTGRLNITADGYNSAEEWKAQLARWNDEGAPLTIVYELETPEIKTITDDSYPDYKFIKVEGDGELIAENENKNPVPWTVTFAEV